MQGTITSTHSASYAELGMSDKMFEMKFAVCSKSFAPAREDAFGTFALRKVAHSARTYAICRGSDTRRYGNRSCSVAVPRPDKSKLLSLCVRRRGEVIPHATKVVRSSDEPPLLSHSLSLRYASSAVGIKVSDEHRLSGRGSAPRPKGRLVGDWQLDALVRRCVGQPVQACNGHPQPRRRELAVRGT
jgi:hypothetical protein